VTNDIDQMIRDLGRRLTHSRVEEFVEFMALSEGRRSAHGRVTPSPEFLEYFFSEVAHRRSDRGEYEAMDLFAAWNAAEIAWRHGRSAA
jgi:hypothetical protein